ncbi:hypothetical protein ZWY2020_005632 [Hordeum vulgare]|nr:hypothetical protein ZWY2020_005632 [Hordeum vulgare]
MEENQEERQAPAAAAAPARLPLPPPGPLPPPATDDGHLELLGVLRVRARGHPAWMLPRYINLGVDVYRFHPQDLVETYPPATAADGSSAVFFINIVHHTTATDHRSRRSVPGGTWTSDRAPVPLISGCIQGYRQAFSFKVSGPHVHGKRLRLGYLMQELTLPSDEGAMEGGDELVLSKVYPTLHGDVIGSDLASTSNKTRKIGAGSPAQEAVAPAASSNACFSSAPALRLGSSSPAAHRAPSPAPPLRLKKKREATDISFTYEELNAATWGFPRDHLLGEGLLGKVYKGLLNRNAVAIRILNPGWQGSREFCTEVMVLSKMNHPNLVKLVGFCADDDRRLLVYEFMPLGSLETHIFGRKHPYSMGQNRMGAELTLIQWAANLIARKDFGTLVDQMLTNQYSITELCRALTIARMCLKGTASERPEMVDVAAALAYIST